MSVKFNKQESRDQHVYKFFSSTNLHESPVCFVLLHHVLCNRSGLLLIGVSSIVQLYVVSSRPLDNSVYMQLELIPKMYTPDVPGCSSVNLLQTERSFTSPTACRLISSALKTGSFSVSKSFLSRSFFLCHLYLL